MKIYLKSKSYRPRLEVNMALYGHILSIILVILLAAITPLWVYNISSPAALSMNISQPKAQAPWILSIEKEGEYYLKQGQQLKKFISLDSLKNIAVQEINVARQHNRSIWLKVNPQVTYGHVKQIMLLLQSLGIQQVGLITASHSTQP